MFCYYAGVVAVGIHGKLCFIIEINITGSGKEEHNANRERYCLERFPQIFKAEVYKQNEDRGKKTYRCGKGVIQREVSVFEIPEQVYNPDHTLCAQPRQKYQNTSVAA